LREILHIAYRYGLSMAGPIAVSAAHFITSLIVLRCLPPEAFGQFSFLLVVVPFALSGVAALLSAPAAQTRGKPAEAAAADTRILMKASVPVSLVSALAVFALMRLAHASTAAALWFSLYGLFFTQRGFARALANVRVDYPRVAASDFIYAVLLTTGMAALAIASALNVETGALVFAVSAACCLATFGGGYFRPFLFALAGTALKDYVPIWRSVTRWSLSGVVLTEATINAHAYLVTFVVGPHAFGLLSVGALFMRPASLVMSALPEIDMPVMNKHLADRDAAGAFKVMRNFRYVTFLALAVNVLLAAAILIWFPQAVLKKGYDRDAVECVIAFWVAIVALRAVRTPPCVFLQAANRYQVLAKISMVSGVVSLVATAALLFLFGPVASLGGLVLGEVAVVLAVGPVIRAYRIRHA
jgi:O-antigen/teichoic acid export membrane protein